MANNQITDDETRQEEIINMFNNIATTYDTANRVISMGVDVTWRKEACKEAFKNVKSKQINIADIACGTGDMMLHWENEGKESNREIKSIIGVDPSECMLNVAMEKIPHGIFKIAQASKIPLESCSQDIVSIAYGLRNVVQRKDALKEFYRILRPNGVLVILEFTAPSTNNLLSSLMQFYTKAILPIIGGAISRNFKAYKYLPNSINNFITRESLEAELLLHGMKTIFSKNYSANVSSLIIAQK